jgi:hypothetical protein
VLTGIQGSPSDAELLASVKAGLAAYLPINGIGAFGKRLTSRRGHPGVGLAMLTVLFMAISGSALLNAKASQ